MHVWSNIPAVKRYPCVHQGPGGLEAHQLGPITREPGRLRELCPGSLCGHLGAPHKFWTSSRAVGPLSTSGPSSPLSHWSFLSNSPLDELLDVSHPACVPQFPVPKLWAPASPCTPPPPRECAQSLISSHSSYTQSTYSHRPTFSLMFRHALLGHTELLLAPQTGLPRAFTHTARTHTHTHTYTHTRAHDDTHSPLSAPRTLSVLLIRRNTPSRPLHTLSPSPATPLLRELCTPFLTLTHAPPGPWRRRPSLPSNLMPLAFALVLPASSRAVSHVPSS